MRLSRIFLLTLALPCLVAACAPAAPANTAPPTAVTSTPAALLPPQLPVTMAPATPAAGLPIRPAPERMKRLTYQAGAAIAEKGIFFMDTATGQVEGWGLQGNPSPELLYTASADNRFVVASDRVQGYLLDRQRGTAYQWSRAELELAPNSALMYVGTVASSAHRLLFERVERPTGAEARPSGSFVIVDDSLQQVSAFTLPAGQPTALLVAMFSPDETLLLINSRQPLERKLYLVDVASGTTRATVDLADLGETYWTVSSLGVAPGGKGFAVLLWRRPAGAVLRRYGWEGQPLGDVALPSRFQYPAPNGEFVAWEETGSETPAIVVADAATGKPRFRVRGASFCYGDFGWAGSRWLADSSGLVVVDKNGYAIVSARDGSLTPLPFAKADPAEAPLPAPDSAARFALGRLGVISTDTNKRLAVTVPGVHPYHLEPWGALGRELRFTTIPRPGHDELCDPSRALAPAQVEMLN